MGVLRRVGVGLLVAVLAIATVGIVGGVVAARASFPSYDGEVELRGLTAPVKVFRDAHGVPQVYADNPADLFRAQGFLHAQDRFWEMDFRRHVTAGRLAEMFGAGQVETDAYIRTMGWRRVAEAEYRILDPDSRRWLQAYADGVNAWLADHSGVSASLEYGVLALQNPGYRIEKWSPVDSVAWLKAMAWDLRGNMSQELSRAELLASGLSRDEVEELYPAYPDDRHAPILTTGGVRRGAFDQAATTSEAVGEPPAGGAAGGVGESPVGGSAGGVGELPVGGSAGGAGELPVGDDVAAMFAGLRTGLAKLPELLGPNGHGIGSNSWVIAGSRTATGKPLLANDPHLGPSAPSTWYQVGLHCTTVTPDCPFDVAGFSFSGLPGVVIGHNARIAWGFTNLEPDTVDLYLEKVRGDDYEVADGRQEPLETRTERIKVAGGDTVTLKVRTSRHGPLLSDQDSSLRGVGEKAPVQSDGLPASGTVKTSPRYAVALRWTALDPGRTADALFALNAAVDWTTFRAAARLFAVPAQNMVYADVEGNIGYQTPGDIPIREGGDGRWPVPGWVAGHEWRGRVPFDALPRAFNPPSGYVATANQQVIGPGYPYMLTTDWDYGYRGQRIADLIAGARKPLDVGAVERAQFDSRNGNAATLAPRLLAVDVPARVRKAQELLGDWDHSQPANSAPAAFFNATWRHLLARTFDEIPDDLAPDGGARWFEVVRGLLDDPDAAWWDDQSTPDTERRDDILRAAMVDAERELSGAFGSAPSGWRWGDLHTLTIRNQSLGRSGVAPIEWMFNRGPYPAAGGDSVVNATGWTAPDGYQVDWVPSMRMVVDLADLDRSRWVNLTGASGHAFHRYYADQTGMWQHGESTPMRWDRETIERDARHQMTLRP